MARFDVQVLEGMMVANQEEGRRRDEHHDPFNSRSLAPQALGPLSDFRPFHMQVPKTQLMRAELTVFFRCD